jgi:hypothetical protein
MPRLLPRQEPIDRRPLRTAYAPVCLACGERDRFAVAHRGQIRCCTANELEPGRLLRGCGRCRARHTIVMEIADDAPGT